MANQIDSERFILFDNWPWAPYNNTPPLDGFLGSTHHNVTAPVYPLGTKITVLNDGVAAGVAGPSTFIYLKGLSHTEANPTVAAKQVCLPSVAGAPYQVTNDPDRNLMLDGCPMVCVAISVMTFTQTVIKHGWFWCGGVVPESWVADLGGMFETDGSVAIGLMTGQNSTGDAIGFGPVATTEGACGFAYADDTA